MTRRAFICRANCRAPDASFCLERQCTQVGGNFGKAHGGSEHSRAQTIGILCAEPADSDLPKAHLHLSLLADFEVGIQGEHDAS